MTGRMLLMGIWLSGLACAQDNDSGSGRDGSEASDGGVLDRGDPPTGSCDPDPLASHGSTTGCDQINRDYIDYVLPAYSEYSEAAGYAAHDYGEPSR